MTLEGILRKAAVLGISAKLIFNTPALSNLEDVSHYNPFHIPIAEAAMLHQEEIKEETSREKMYLINLARQTLYWHLKDGTIPSVDESKLSDNLKEKKACFVTLEKKDFGLRGCMGMFEPVKTPLYHNVRDRAIAAATRDYRYDPVTYDELKDIKVEISILTKPYDINFKDADDLVSKLKPFEDGVILSTPYGSSTYLPQVWEKFPNTDDFLSTLCAKHGAPSNYWKENSKNINIQVYHANVFGEEVYGNRVVGKNGAVVGKEGAFVLGAVEPLPEGLYFGDSGILKAGTELAPGAILTSNSDIIER